MMIWNVDIDDIDMYLCRYLSPENPENCKLSESDIPPPGNWDSGKH